MHDPLTQSHEDIDARCALEDYFNHSAGSSTEKLENFAKYVPRQYLARFLPGMNSSSLSKNYRARSWSAACCSGEDC